MYYFDSSVVLAILLEENRKKEAMDLWIQARPRVSSVLLKLETVCVLRRTYEHNKTKLKPTWFSNKIVELGEYMQEISIRILDESIEEIISLRKDISRLRTLDAIHIATALDLARIVPESTSYFYTFDKEMAAIARSLKFNVNKSRAEDLI